MSRVGDANDDELAALGATVIDLTDVKANDSSNHSKFDQLAAVAPELRDTLAHGIDATPESVGNGGGVGDALGKVVSLPITLLGAPVRIIANQ